MKTARLLEHLFARVRHRLVGPRYLPQWVNSHRSDSLKSALLALEGAVSGRRLSIIGVSAFVSEALQLDGRAAAEWHEKAAWSWAATRLVLDRLMSGREGEVWDLIDHDSLAQLMTRVHPGTIFAGGHIGALGAMRFVVGKVLPDALCVVGTDRHSISDRDVSMEGDPDAAKRSLLTLLLHLRGGKQIYIAADGRRGVSDKTSVHIFGRNVQLRRGVAALARVSRCPTVPAYARWVSGNQIRIEMGGAFNLPSPEDFKHAPLEWEVMWLEKWARWYESVVRADPLNATLEGGLWDHRAGGLLQ